MFFDSSVFKYLLPSCHRASKEITYPEGNSMSYGYFQADEKQRRSAGNLVSIAESPGPRGNGGSDKPATTFTYDGYFNQLETTTYSNAAILLLTSVRRSGEGEHKVHPARNVRKKPKRRIAEFPVVSVPIV